MICLEKLLTIMNFCLKYEKNNIIIVTILLLLLLSLYICFYETSDDILIRPKNMGKAHLLEITLFSFFCILRTVI